MEMFSHTGGLRTLEIPDNILACKIAYFYLFHNQFSKPKGRKWLKQV
jgi:hypothetical protein